MNQHISTGTYASRIQEASDFIKYRLQDDPAFVPSIGLVLGSGLGDMVTQITEPIYIPYHEIPHFPVSTVAGHAGQLVIGELQGKLVIAMQGRFHYYEGYEMQQVVFPIYVMKHLGIQSLIITNAAGGLNRRFKPGDFMLIQDHINLTGDNPLIGPHDPSHGVRFPDMSSSYDRQLIKLAHSLAQEMDCGDSPLQLQEGVYCGISGPAYMTPAELKMLELIGGDAVGMSTVGEVIAARHAGLQVLGISCITDMAIGEELEPLTHEQVVAVAEAAKPRFIQLITRLVESI